MAGFVHVFAESFQAVGKRLAGFDARHPKFDEQVGYPAKKTQVRSGYARRCEPGANLQGRRKSWLLWETRMRNPRRARASGD
jgi:hypothetical protein